MTIVNIPWVDKYRPLKLSNIIQQTNVITILKNMIQTRNIPHMLLYGPPGTGKTSTIYAFALELFGSKFDERVLELNASDERGIGVVRTKIAKFVKTSINNKPNIPPLKLIIMDEADAMTYEAQSALRKLMELTQTTRFCFICNYKSQIIDAIESRCACFRFKLIDKNILIKKIDNIAELEKINIDKTVSPMIAEISEGDVRRAIMILHNMKYIQKDVTLTSVDVEDITGQILKIEIDINNLKNQSVIDINKLVNNLINDSYPIIYIIEYIKNLILKLEIDETKKSKILIYIANTEALLIKKSNEYIQLLALIIYIQHIIIS